MSSRRTPPPLFLSSSFFVCPALSSSLGSRRCLLIFVALGSRLRCAPLPSALGSCLRCAPLLSARAYVALGSRLRCLSLLFVSALVVCLCFCARHVSSVLGPRVFSSRTACLRFSDCVLSVFPFSLHSPASVRGPCFSACAFALGLWCLRSRFVLSLSVCAFVTRLVFSVLTAFAFALGSCFRCPSRAFVALTRFRFLMVCRAVLRFSSTPAVPICVSLGLYIYILNLFSLRPGFSVHTYSGILTFIYFHLPRVLFLNFIHVILAVRQFALRVLLYGPTKVLRLLVLTHTPFCLDLDSGHLLDILYRFSCIMHLLSIAIVLVLAWSFWSWYLYLVVCCIISLACPSTLDLDSCCCWELYLFRNYLVSSRSRSRRGLRSSNLVDRCDGKLMSLD